MVIYFSCVDYDMQGSTIACLHDQNKCSFFRGPDFFHPIRVFL